MEWNEMEWNEIEWNEIEWNEIEWNGMLYITSNIYQYLFRIAHIG